MMHRYIREAGVIGHGGLLSISFHSPVFFLSYGGRGFTIKLVCQCRNVIGLVSSIVSLVHFQWAKNIPGKYHHQMLSEAPRIRKSY